MTRQGRYTVMLDSRPVIIGRASVVGKKEGEGPLGAEYDFIYEDATAGESSWEKAESAMHRDALMRAIKKSGIPENNVDIVFAGDLLDQCTGSTFGIKDIQIPFAGLYGACSTMALSLCMAGISVESGFARVATASTSSHFCSAEKQFRTPLEYGGQRDPASQWTATAAGAAVVASSGNGARIESVHIGRIVDYSIKDANNMGAAMAPEDVKLTPCPSNQNINENVKE